MKKLVLLVVLAIVACAPSDPQDTEVQGWERKARGINPVNSYSIVVL